MQKTLKMQKMLKNEEEKNNNNNNAHMIRHYEDYVHYENN